MRSLSGTRNRVVLAVVGLLAIVAGVWLLVTAFDLVAPGSQLDPVIPDPDATVGDLAAGNQDWLLVSAVIVSVVTVLVGVGILLAQIPTAPDRPRIRVTEPQGAVLAQLDACVLERALEERLETLHGIDRASLRVAGSQSALRVQGELSIEEGSEVEWVVARSRRLVADDVTTALGTAPAGVDLLIRLQPGKSGSGGDRERVALRRVADSGEHAALRS